MIAFSPEYIETKNRIVHALANSGWAIASSRDRAISCQIAQKGYNTAVGVKVATISLEPWSSSLMIVSNYESERRNSLATTTMPVDNALDEVMLKAAVGDYLNNVERSVNATYARRLHLNSLRGVTG